MARAIDADRLLQVLETNFGHTGGADVMRQLIEAQPTLTPPNETRIINADKLAKRIAGHSNYHGDSILSAIYCAAEGKENNAPIRPIENPPNEWVSVEDAVPDPGVRVLAANGNFVGEAYMASNGAWMRHDGFPWKADAWIPLPEPPDRRPPEGEADETE